MEHTAREIMTKRLVTAKPSDTIAEAARRMAENGVGSVIVEDDEGRLAGIFTERDLVKMIARGVSPSTPLREVMTTNLVTASPDEPVTSVLCKMLRNNIRHIPVVEDSKPIGIVSMRDMIRLEVAEQHLCQ